MLDGKSKTYEETIKFIADALKQYEEEDKRNSKEEPKK